MTDKQSLENLLLDVDSWNELSKYAKDTNIFNILRIGGVEIRHSIMLAYLLNPNESHGLGAKVLEAFITRLSTHERIEIISLFDLMDIDYYDFTVFREYKYIDLLIKSNKYKVVICIENKVWYGEHSNQLERYKKTVDDEFPDFKKVFVFLTPEGIEASDNINWVNIGYDYILDIIESIDKSNINEKIKILINDYIDLVRRNILMTDTELKEICNKIYRRHKQAIDLIIENKEDDVYYFYSIINSYLKDKHDKGILLFNEEYSSTKTLRFTTSRLEREFPLIEDGKGVWKNGWTCIYAITITNNRLVCELYFSDCDVDKDIQYTKIKSYLEKLDLKTTKDAWVNGHHISSKFSSIPIETDNTFDTEKDTKYIWDALDKIFLPIFDKEKEI